MNDPDELSPEAPYTVTITWAIGDSLVVSYPDLMPWEARAVLEEAIEQVRADAALDSESIEED